MPWNSIGDLEEERRSSCGRRSGHSSDSLAACVSISPFHSHAIDHQRIFADDECFDADPRLSIKRYVLACDRYVF